MLAIPEAEEAVVSLPNADNELLLNSSFLVDDELVLEELGEVLLRSEGPNKFGLKFSFKIVNAISSSSVSVRFVSPPPATERPRLIAAEPEPSSFFLSCFRFFTKDEES